MVLKPLPQCRVASPSRELAEENGRLLPPSNTFTSDEKTWRNASLLSVTQISDSGLRLLHLTSLEMRDLVKEGGDGIGRGRGGDDRLKNRILASIFFEPSTRTSCSFRAAMTRLGGTTLHLDCGGGKSGGGDDKTSTAKGESLSDTVRSLECYTDITVLRHPIEGSVAAVAAAKAANGERNNGLINAGDGTGEHPTQALLDLFTIVDELRLFRKKSDVRTPQSVSHSKPLVVTMVGDLRNGRTVHSLARLLARCQGGFLEGRKLVLRYCPASKSLGMPEGVRKYVESFAGRSDKGENEISVVQEDMYDLSEAVNGSDVLYVTRIQKERFEDEDEYRAVKGAYVVNAELMAQSPPNMIVMHPLPRVDEIDTKVDNDPRAAYFRQMENGMYVRMAILALMLGRA